MSTMKDLGIELSHQVWQQVPLPTESSCQASTGFRTLFFFLECLSCGRYCSFYFQDFTPLLQPHEKGSVSRADAQGGICSSSDLSRK